VTVLPPHASQYPSSWSDSISVATLGHADGRTHIVGRECFDEVFEEFVTAGIEKREELFGF
jgi:hypothetical protein